MYGNEESPAVVKNSLVAHAHKIVIRFGIPLVAIALAAFGLYSIYNRWYSTHHKTTTPAVASTEKKNEQSPSEVPVPVVDGKPPFSYLPSQPAIISIPQINVRGYIQQVGVNTTGAVGVPSNIHLAGWFTSSVLPGAKGLSILDGHVSGKYIDGIFKHFASVKINNIIEIEFGDKSTKKFSVVEIKKLPEAESVTYLFTHRPEIVAQLNLITCGGKFNSKTQTYNDRVIIVAKLI
ncbi:MAG: class F sortase [Candidatus Saccharibacteria bacterium]